MIRIALIAVSLLLFSEYVDASIISYFKDEEGQTKWQYVANFSGSVLIVLLSLTMLSLLISRYKLGQRNRELRDIKSDLEATVVKRTENLNKSNRLLQSEVEEHKATEALLKSSETYLSSILASMPSMLIGLNDALQITHWNKTAESITGLNGEAVLGSDLWDVYPTITVSPDQVKKVLLSRQPETIKHSQRGQYYFDITVYPLAGDQEGVVVVVENVTQRSLAENMLIQRDKMASMGELAATMAYDINSPLQGILKDVDVVLKEAKLEESISNHSLSLLDDALERGKQASSVVQNLLEFSGSHGSEKHPENISDVVDHCIELAHNVLSGPSGLKFRDIQIHKNYQSPISTLDCYVAELQQVFLSILRHACQSMALRKTKEEFNPELQVQVSEADGSLWVKFTHNGVPLTSDEQQEIFEPFVQQTTPVNPKPLVPENRLSFSYFVVTEHHDGELAVTSNQNNGTSFHIQFYLPLS